MCSGNVTSFPANKACSGKCKGGGGCGGAPRIWVIAACAGMIALFEKQPDGHMTLLPQAGKSVAASMEDFTHTISSAAEGKRFDQLLLIGSSNDVAWMRHALPAQVTRNVAAEIEYPLVAGWFNQAESGQLSHALENVLAG